MNLRVFFIPIILFVLSFSASAQQTEDPDVLFRMARESAFESKDYEKAIALAKQALELAPQYLDVKEFLGRVYLWNNQPNLAESLLEDVLDKEPVREYARITLIDVKLGKNQYNEGLALANIGLSIDPTNVFFLLRKAAALSGLNENIEVVEIYNEVLRIEPNNPIATAQLRELNEYVFPWAVNASTNHSFFQESIDPWYQYSVNLSRKTQIGSFGALLNIGNRFALDDQQIQIYSYPVLSDKMYAYLSAGTSNNVFYPKLQLVGSLYRAFPKSFEGEIGYRFLRFNQIEASIITASILKFERKNRFAVRSFFTINEINTGFTALFNYRRILSMSDNFIEVNLGYGGNSAQFNSSSEIVDAKSSSSAGISIQHRIIGRLVAGAGVSYSYEQFRGNTERNRLDLSANIGYRF